MILTFSCTKKKIQNTRVQASYCRFSAVLGRGLPKGGVVRGRGKSLRCPGCLWKSVPDS
jgi:hypothetical protein